MLNKAFGLLYKSLKINDDGDAEAWQRPFMNKPPVGSPSSQRSMHAAKGPSGFLLPILSRFSIQTEI